jgi:uncharacterized protein YuzE
MQVTYNTNTDALYIRLDEAKQDVINRRVSDEVVLDVGKNDRIAGIEILDASENTNLKSILPVEYQIEAGVDA